jgi:hypothetical protein
MEANTLHLLYKLLNSSRRSSKVKNSKKRTPDAHCHRSKHLPILDLDAEMSHYNISNPYGEHGQYCIDHYICLWKITEREIVGHWEWDEFIASGNWYEDIIMPAFRDFVRRSAEK